MKINKIWLNLFIGIVALLSIGISPAHAVDLSIWEGSWISFKVKVKGFSFPSDELESKPQKISVRDLKFIHIDSIDTVFDDITINATLYMTDKDGLWTAGTFTMYYIGGTQLDFVVTSDASWQSDSADEDMDLWPVLRITGKLDTNGEELKSAKIKSAGGEFWSQDDEFIGAGAITASGSLLNTDKFCSKSKNAGAPPCK